MRRRAADPARGAERGFTVLELTVVMGLLAVFMAFLLQIVFSTTEVFTQGQDDQEKAAFALAATRPVEAALRGMVGPTFEDKHQASDARLLVQYAPIGFAAEAPSGEIQVLRSSIHLPRYQEKELLAAKYRKAVEQTAGEEPEQVEAAVQKLLRSAAFKARGEMLLIAWPEGDEEGAFLELRRGVFLPDQPLPFKEAQGSSLLWLRELARDFPAEQVPAHTEVIATGLLHLGFRLSSQYTRSWVDGPDGKGPEETWDSARAGWFLDAKDRTRKFGLDLGDISRTNSVDDVYPHYIEVTVVSCGSSQELPEAHLNERISADQQNIELINTDRLPRDIHDNYLKIGSEWIQYSSLRGRTLTGCRRGLRNTRAVDHDRRTGVRAGRTAVLMIEIGHARDSWNG